MLIRIMDEMRSAIEAITSESNAVVTEQRLLELGVVEKGGDGSIGVAGGSANLAVPPVPANLVATGGLGVIFLSWDAPGYSNHSHTEIYRAPGTETNVANAVLIGTARPNFYADSVGDGSTYNYWIRFVSTSAVSGPYLQPHVQASASVDPTYALTVLTGSITESQLYNALNTRINLIDTPVTGLVDRIGVAEGDILVNQQDISQAQADILTNAGNVSNNAAAITTLDSRVTTAEGSITVNSSDITRLKAQQAEPKTVYAMLFSDDFDPAQWFNAEGSGTAMTIVPSGETPLMGPKVLRVEDTGTGNSEWRASNKVIIPFDPDKLYKLTLRARRLAGSGLLYFGWRGFDANFQYVNRDGAATPIGEHWHGGNAVSLPATFNTYTGYTQGFGATFGFATAGTLASPGYMHPSVRYIEPIVLVNYPGTTGSITEVDYFLVEDYTPYASATAISSLDTRVTTAEGSITTNASAITALEATVNDPVTGVNANATAITATNATVTQNGANITSNTNRIVSLETTVNDPTTGVSATSTALSSLTTTVNSNGAAITANTNRIVSLESTVDDPTTGLVQTRAELLTEQTTRANADSAMAADITTLQSDVAGNTASIQTEATTRATETGLLSAEYVLKLDVNGHIAGMGVSVSGGASGPIQSEFLVKADKFAIITPAAEWQPATTYAGGAVVVPQAPYSATNLQYRASGGTGPSGATQPTWPTVIGNTVNDNGITWTAEAFKQQIPFVVGNVGGISTIGIDGALVVDNSITANSIAANTVTVNELNVIDLASITNGEMGTLTSGTVKTAADPARRLEISSIGAYPLWFGSNGKTAQNANFLLNLDGTFEWRTPNQALSIKTDAATTEMEFWGDPGNGTNVKLGSIGVAPGGLDTTVATFGQSTAGFSRTAVAALSDTRPGMYAESNSSYAAYFVSSGAGTPSVFAANSNPSFAGGTVHATCDGLATSAALKGIHNVAGYGLIAASLTGIGIQSTGDDGQIEMVRSTRTAKPPNHVAPEGTLIYFRDTTNKSYLYLNIDGTSTGWRPIQIGLIYN